MVLGTSELTGPVMTMVSPPSWKQVAESPDHADIADIQIAPTTEELMKATDSYMPVNLVGARHHLPSDSVEKMYVSALSGMS